MIFTSKWCKTYVELVFVVGDGLMLRKWGRIIYCKRVTRSIVIFSESQYCALALAHLLDGMSGVFFYQVCDSKSDTFVDKEMP